MAWSKAKPSATRPICFLHNIQRSSQLGKRLEACRGQGSTSNTRLVLQEIGGLYPGLNSDWFVLGASVELEEGSDAGSTEAAHERKQWQMEEMRWVSGGLEPPTSTFRENVACFYLVGQRYHDPVGDVLPFFNIRVDDVSGDEIEVGEAHEAGGRTEQQPPLGKQSQGGVLQHPGCWQTSSVQNGEAQFGSHLGGPLGMCAVRPQIHLEHWNMEDWV